MYGRCGPAGQAGPELAMAAWLEQASQGRDAHAGRATGRGYGGNPAPLDPAASRAEGAGAPGTDANTGSDLAASVVADGVNAVPGVASARRVLRAGLEGEALQMAVRFDRELDAAEWFEQLVQRG